jgi:hypothetical protein
MRCEDLESMRDNKVWSTRVGFRPLAGRLAGNFPSSLRTTLPLKCRVVERAKDRHAPDDVYRSNVATTPTPVAMDTHRLIAAWRFDPANDLSIRRKRPFRACRRSASAGQASERADCRLDRRVRPLLTMGQLLHSLFDVVRKLYGKKPLPGVEVIFT